MCTLQSANTMRVFVTFSIVNFVRPPLPANRPEIKITVKNSIVVFQKETHQQHDSDGHHATSLHLSLQTSPKTNLQVAVTREHLRPQILTQKHERSLKRQKKFKNIINSIEVTLFTCCFLKTRIVSIDRFLFLRLADFHLLCLDVVTNLKFQLFYDRTEDFQPVFL